MNRSDVKGKHDTQVLYNKKKRIISVSKRKLEEKDCGCGEREDSTNKNCKKYFSYCSYFTRCLENISLNLSPDRRKTLNFELSFSSFRLYPSYFFGQYCCQLSYLSKITNQHLHDNVQKQILKISVPNCCF